MHKLKSKDSASAPSTSSKWLGGKLSGIWKPPSKSNPSEAVDSLDSSPTLQDLQHRIQLVRSVLYSGGHVDSSYKKFEKHGEACLNLCLALLRDDSRPIRSMSIEADEPPVRRCPTDASQSPSRFISDHGSMSSGRLPNEAAARHVIQEAYAAEIHLIPIREWKECLEKLSEDLKANLAETFKRYERNHTPEMVDMLFANRGFRREAIRRMKNANLTRVLSADSDFFPRYEIRFRNYITLEKELLKVRRLLQAAESGISLSRDIVEYNVSEQGDAILEFANLGPDALHNDPVLRFRVSSAALAETSPIFSRMFGGQPSSTYIHEAEDISEHLPPLPAFPYACEDGSEVALYRMPQYELNRLHSFEILMNAAHMEHERVPQRITFEQFVAIAECSMRYKSTSPLEHIVEHTWLPQWMYRGADDMSDGLLIISYGFGSRELFTRMSKRAVLNIVDEADLQEKAWPRKIRDKIWAVRSAKVEQIYACCEMLVQEYLKSPGRDVKMASDTRAGPGNAAGTQSRQGPSHLRTCPRCPKGDHSCDAVNLGWMLLVFNEMNLMPRILQPSVLSHGADDGQPPQSLAQLLDTLRATPSPARPVHPNSVCDPSLAFRRAIADISSSVTGLTLHDISGKSHGWGLSKRWTTQPQTNPDRMAPNPWGDGYSVAAEFSDAIRLRILNEVDDLRDLLAVAQVSRDFNRAYRANKARLLARFSQGDELVRSRCKEAPQGAMRSGNAENKSLQIDVPHIMRSVPQDTTDAISLNESYMDGHDDDSDDSNDDLSSPVSSQPEKLAFDDSHGYPINGAPYSDGVLQEDGAERRHESRQVMDDFAGEVPMTREEADRILWPDAPWPAAGKERTKPPVMDVGGREKFRASDKPFITQDDKILVNVDDKHLRADIEQHFGIISKSGDQGTVASSGSRVDGGTSQASRR
ncbi:hypothetical protein AAL_00391 [Moelleriella libera RCEF 2490]|uniref:BTB domain-containing protein n=1 Tax=Moelleriella libera RCEF 2490 TaxID=1081109 RepID=A0A162K447_9HYPO|nr:hypothetical protein AAL_00391 [Moelleriella libera RCEF 2490]